MSDELKPCPWCGEKPVIDKWHETYQVMHECQGYWGVDIKTKLHWNKESAMHAWNRRAQ